MACLRANFEDGIVLDGRYRTVAPLNHGSFGMVFKAKHIETGQDVAIKCLTKKAAADELGYDFATDDGSEESGLHRHLGSHPNIVNLVETFETESHVYLVLEFCPRGDLYEAIRMGQGPLETEHVRNFMMELVDAIEFIHSKGVYHRDIKPENIFLSQTGSMKLGDFGLATTDDWSYEMTVGSDRYMSPEQYDSAGNGYSPAQADIWAVGICLLNILFSRNPFTTPTEADPIFLDFSRDKQCLFDVFPDMSQDTYDVIVECMSMDPTKRSLTGVREALRRVVSFTILEETLDDFCTVDGPVITSANREPLRTPSLQSPLVENGAAFPWAKALQTAPQAIRQLSVIPDNEIYTEDLFSKSEATTADWCSNMTGQTPSMASVMDSSFADSMNSLAISNAMAIPQAKTKVSPMAGSLPIAMPRPRIAPSMSLVFGRKEAVSKSWSDMWDEEEEEEEERQRQLESLKNFNTRDWNQQESNAAAVVDDVKPVLEKVSSKLTLLAEDDNTPRVGLSPATKTLSIATPTLAEKQELPALDDLGELDDDLLFTSDPASDDEKPTPAREHERRDLDNFFGRKEPRQARSQHQPIHLSVRLANPDSVSHSPLSSASKSPSSMDKWKALGERRRACTGGSVNMETSKSHEEQLRTSEHPFGRPIGSSFNSASPYGYGGHGINLGASPQHMHTSYNQHYNHHPTTITTPSPKPHSHYLISSHNSGNNSPAKLATGKDTSRSRSKENKDRPVAKSQSRGWNWNWRRDRSAVGWVGGW